VSPGFLAGAPIRRPRPSGPVASGAVGCARGPFENGDGAWGGSPDATGDHSPAMGLAGRDVAPRVGAGVGRQGRRSGESTCVKAVSRGGEFYLLIGAGRRAWLPTEIGYGDPGVVGQVHTTGVCRQALGRPRRRGAWGGRTSTGRLRTTGSARRGSGPGARRPRAFSREGCRGRGRLGGRGFARALCRRASGGHAAGRRCP